MMVGGEIGNFVIDAEIGSGSFGVVYRAHNKTSSEMRRAFKVLRPEATGNPDLARLFLREAAVLQTVDSPHVCRIFDVGYTAEQQPYISMELLEGETLSQVLAHGRLPVRAALEYLIQVCDGLAEVHRHGFTHRDVKPANIFVTAAGEAPVLKLLDFNIAKGIQNVVGSTLSSGDTGPGTDHYMSPEQILDPAAVDATTDIWAAGVVLFEMVAGHVPFNGLTSGAIKVAIVNGDRQSLPPEAAVVEPIISRCLADRRDRHASAQELKAHALRLLATLGMPATHAARVTAEGTPPPPAALAAASRPVQAPTTSVRLRDLLARRWLVASLGLFGVGLTLLLGSFAVHPALNEFTVAGKRVGYTSSFNCTLVYTFIAPLALALLGTFLRRANATFARIGPTLQDEWNRRARSIVVMSALLSLCFAVGYTAVEWHHLMAGRCSSGPFLGWPNLLCQVAHGDPGILGFMWLNAFAQTAILCISWMWFSVIIWTCEMLFTNAALWRSRDTRSIAELLGMAMWGWVMLFVGLFIARLYSFHLQTPGTDGILQTLTIGLPGSLLDINAHTQPDMGSMIAGTITFGLAIGPFALLRLGGGSTATTQTLSHAQRSVAVFGTVGLIALIFPRLGVLCLTATALLIVSVSRLRRALPRVRPVG